jgi:hypothetical protein
MKEQWWITTCIAISGLVLSLYNTITSRRDKVAKLRVTVQPDMCIMQPGRKPSEKVMIVHVANIGAVPVTLASQGFSIKSGGHLFHFDPPFGQKLPYELLPGKGADIVAMPSVISEALMSQGNSGSVQLRPYFTDQIGRLFRGEWFKFEVMTAAIK